MRGHAAGAGKILPAVALLVLVPLAVLTGLFANTIGVDWPLDPAQDTAAEARALVEAHQRLAPLGARLSVFRARTPGRWRRAPP